MPPDDDSDPLGEVSARASRLREAEDLHRESASALAQAMFDAHQRGHTWSQIAVAAGLASPKTARTRAERAMDPADLSPSVRWRQTRGQAPRPKTDPPGVSISEAARRLEITRKTVYAWIEKGKLRTATDEAGRPRVLLDD